MQRRLHLIAALVVVLFGLTAGVAYGKPILMLTVSKEVAKQRRILSRHLISPLGPVQPPAPPCPENGMLPPPLSNCGLPELPATTLPFPGNMAYWGGHIQRTPKIYIVYWGWGEKGAFPARRHCRQERLSEGGVHGKLRCDPDGAGRRMANWVSQLGGTRWAGVQKQYFELSSSGARRHITNPRHQLAGLWADDADRIAKLRKTSADAAPGAKNTYTDLAREAARAVRHFHITKLRNADIVVAQPPRYSDPNALSTGYCAFHDYTDPTAEKGIYKGIKPGIPFTNMPYVLAINSGGTNECGKNAVNQGKAGKLDGFSIVLGHEIEETVTDPGAEDINGRGLHTENLGGWYDAIDANENGDKCAWVGESLTGSGRVTPIPGALGDIRGNRGTRFAVQSLWSNRALSGLGYCAGAGNDRPATG